MSIWIRAGNALLALACALSFSGAVQAQPIQTWVSGVGDDANPCSRTAPCKTISGTIAQTASGGTISFLDSGGFGAVTITKPITIQGDGALASILTSGTNAITINISTPGVDDRVVLRNLVLDGSPSVSGLNGVRIMAADTVLIEHCFIHNFSGSGVLVQTTADVNVVIKDTAIDHIGGAGISVSSTAVADVATEDVQMSSSAQGILAGAGSRVHALRTTAAGNSTSGFEADGSAGTARIILDHSAATAVTNTSTGGIGVWSYGSGAKITLAHSTLTQNDIGISAVSGGQVFSFGNSRTSGNTIDGAPTAELGEQ